MIITLAMQLSFKWHKEPSCGQLVARAWDFEISWGDWVAQPIQLTLDFGPETEWPYVYFKKSWVEWLPW